MKLTALAPAKKKTIPLSAKLRVPCTAAATAGERRPAKREDISQGKAEECKVAMKQALHCLQVPQGRCRLRPGEQVVGSSTEV